MKIRKLHLLVCIIGFAVASPSFAGSFYTSFDNWNGIQDWSICGQEDWTIPYSLDGDNRACMNCNVGLQGGGIEMTQTMNFEKYQSAIVYFKAPSGIPNHIAIAVEGKSELENGCGKFTGYFAFLGNDTRVNEGNYGGPWNLYLAIEKSWIPDNSSDTTNCLWNPVGPVTIYPDRWYELFVSVYRTDFTHSQIVAQLFDGDTLLGFTTYTDGPGDVDGPVILGGRHSFFGSAGDTVPIYWDNYSVYWSY